MRKYIAMACLVLLLLAGTCTAYYTRGLPQNPGHANPAYDALQDRLFMWDGYFHNQGDIVIMLRAQQGAKVLGHGLGQKVARLGATAS